MSLVQHKMRKDVAPPEVKVVPQLILEWDLTQPDQKTALRSNNAGSGSGWCMFYVCDMKYQEIDPRVSR